MDSTPELDERRIASALQKERIQALNEFTELVEEKQQELGWSDDTYYQLWNAAKKINDAASKIVVSSVALDAKIGRSLVNDIVTDMWLDDNPDTELLPGQKPPGIPNRPFLIEFCNERDISLFSRSLMRGCNNVEKLEAVHSKIMKSKSVQKKMRAVRQNS